MATSASPHCGSEGSKAKSCKSRLTKCKTKMPTRNGPARMCFTRYPGLHYSIMFIQFTQFAPATTAYLIANFVSDLRCCCNYGHKNKGELWPKLKSKLKSLSKIVSAEVVTTGSGFSA